MYAKEKGEVRFTRFWRASEMANFVKSGKKVRVPVREPG